MIRTFEIRHRPNQDGFDQYTIRINNDSPFVDKQIRSTNDEADLFVALADWLVPMTCPACEWEGMRDDCRNNQCPNCGARPRRDKTKGGGHE